MVNAAIAMGVPDRILRYGAAEGLLFAARFAQQELDGLDGGVWFFNNEPTRIPAPGEEGLAAWADDWLDEGTRTEKLRGVVKKNSLWKLRQSGRIFDEYGFHLAPMLKAILDASAGLQGHTVAIVVMTESPHDGAEFVATMKRAAKYPVFWVFIGVSGSAESSCHLGVVDTLGKEPGDPDNFVVLKVNFWTRPAQWLTARRIKKALRRWQKRTPTG
ncbi:hypothetical protein ACFV8Z_39540 [Streptomyces sp. NPDC059837]|uniref:hypothetical protein n=1 Tax=unclassified Streptomyces TaxID=2593676 RepID=UPI00365F0174